MPWRQVEPLARSINARPEDLLPKDEGPISLHDIGLLESLSMADKMGMKIDTVVIGVEPKVLDWGMELSEEVKSKSQPSLKWY